MCDLWGALGNDNFNRVVAPTKRKAGDPLVISDVKKGSVAYRYG